MNVMQFDLGQSIHAHSTSTCNSHLERQDDIFRESEGVSNLDMIEKWVSSWLRARIWNGRELAALGDEGRGPRHIQHRFWSMTDSPLSSFIPSLRWIPAH